MIRILGVDPSLTRTGLCLPDGTTTDMPTDPKTWPNPFARIARIANEVFRYVGLADIVVIEGAMMSTRVGPETMWLHYEIRRYLWASRVPFVDIAPASRQKYACGHSKDRAKTPCSPPPSAPGPIAPPMTPQMRSGLWRIATDAYGPADADLPAYRREVLYRYSPWPEINGHAPVWTLPPKPRKKAA